MFPFILSCITKILSLTIPVPRVSLAEDNVNIIEGDSGTFCAVIEDPAAVVDGSIPITLHTMEGTAEGVAI